MAAWWLVLSLVLVPPPPQSAAVRRLAREVVESFGREAVERAEPRVVRLIETLGDDAARALRRSGPAGLSILERHGAGGLRVLLRWGDDGLRVLAHEGDAALAALARHGDAAMDLMVRHPGVGRELLERFGGRAAGLRLSTDGAVDLARLADPIRSSGRSGEILSVVERYGDRACRFIWRNKGVIFGAAALAAFLSDPEPYLDGAKELLAVPLAEAAKRTDWTSVLGGLILVAGVILGVRWSLRAGRP
jgi:hypothetical protein